MLGFCFPRASLCSALVLTGALAELQLPCTPTRLRTPSSALGCPAGACSPPGASPQLLAQPNHPARQAPGERILPRKTASCLQGSQRGALLERAAPELQGAVNSQEPEPEPARLPPPPAVFTVAHMLCSGFVVPAACRTVVRLNARSWCQSLAQFLASGHKFILKHKQRRR